MPTYDLVRDIREHGDDLDPSQLTPIQRRRLRRINNMSRAQLAKREQVSTHSVANTLREIRKKIDKSHLR